MEKVTLMIASGELDGLVNFFSASNVLEAVENNTIEPLDEYLEDNANWNATTESYRNLYSLDGKVYAISAGFEGSTFTRSYRKDWLDRLGMEVPETTGELFEVARAFTESDPDGNGIDDTTGLTSSRLWNLQDIFQAFGAKLNNTGEMSIAWNPVSGVWQDSMLKPEMGSALEYIKKLYDSGYLDADFLTNEGSNMREKLWTGKAGSSFYWAMHAYRQATTEMRKTAPEAKWVEVPALRGTQTQKLNSRVMGGLCYVLVKGTEQPKETVNTFFNMLFDKDMTFMLRYGIEGTTFRWKDDKVIIMTDPATGKPFETPGLIQEMPQFNRYTYPWCYDGSSGEIQETLNLIETEKQMIEKGISDDIIFVIDKMVYDVPVSKEFAAKSADMKKVFEEEAFMAILGEKSISQALDDYRTKMRGLGGDKVLEEANAAIGREPNQKY
jgi:putative aldouronate transport system substrate-binding protein